MKEQEQNISGAVTTRINGQRVRALREAQKLTQLYLATVVEVTTETISRWERQERASIKRENGRKLAQALGVELDDILAVDDGGKQPLSLNATSIGSENAPSAPADSRWRYALHPGVGALLLLILSLLLMLFLGRKDSVPVVRRIMPAHAVAGMPFPVLLMLEDATDDPRSLLLKEEIPAGCRVLQSVPAAALVEPQLLKWVEHDAAGKRLFAYLAMIKDSEGNRQEYIFRGTLRRAGDERVVAGPSHIKVLPFHWADADRNLVIDDEELLEVYDSYGRARGLDLDIDGIESIWMGSGYRFVPEEHRFEIIP